jgi:hypothetical protein
MGKTDCDGSRQLDAAKDGEILEAKDGMNGAEAQMRSDNAA